MAITITQYNSKANTTACNRIPKYIALHYTAGTSSKKGSALSSAKYLANPVRMASADFFVDDDTIIQFNADPTKRYTWAVGGGKNKYPTTSLSNTMNGICTNKNSVSIEMCSNKVSKKAPLNASDRDWYFTDKTLNNTLALVKYLMQLYNIPIQNVVTHCHVTGKLCPAMWFWSEEYTKGYKDFITHLKTGTTYNGYEIPSVNPTKPAQPVTPVQSSYVYQGVDLSPVFSPTFYADKYADLKNAFGYNESKLFSHFCSNGMNEARQAIATFNPIVYRKNYPDLDKAFGDSWIKYYAHYCTSGLKEGRKGI